MILTCHRIQIASFALFITILFYLARPYNTAYSGAWLQKKGRLQVIANMMLTQETIEYRANVQQTATLGGLHGNIYGEYGISDSDTIGWNFLFSTYGTFKDILTVDSSTFGMPVAEVFYRRKVLELKHFVWSIEMTTRMPALYRPNDLGNKIFEYQSQPDVEIKTNIGLSVYDHLTGIPGLTRPEGIFGSASFAYRHKVNLPLDEMRINAMIGVNLHPKITLILDFMKILSIYYSPTGDAEISSYHTGKFTLYLINHTTECLSLVAGLVIEIGRDLEEIKTQIDGGSGIILGLWYTF